MNLAEFPTNIKIAAPLVKRLLRKRVSAIFKIKELALHKRSEKKLEEWKKFLESHSTPIRKKRNSLRVKMPNSDLIHLFSWKNFLLDSFRDSQAEEIAQLFEQNNLTEADLDKLDHALLHNIGILDAKIRLKILKMKDLCLQTKGYNIAGSSADVAQLKNITILNKLGTGNFREVFYGEWNRSPMALKKLKSTEDFEEFQVEVGILSKLSHPNIVQFHGIYQSPDNDHYIVTEYFSRGSLLTNLRELNEEKASVQDLLEIIIQVARGMAYLEEKNIIHKDLACRNLMVAGDTHMIIKVADFGLNNTSETTIIGGSKIPIKWSAPEVLKDGKFTLKSDVFSFYVVLWEIFEFGSEPYGWMASNEEVYEKVIAGQKLPIPKRVPEKLWELMLKCGSTCATDRPGFSQVLQCLQDIIGTN